MIPHEIWPVFGKSRLSWNVNDNQNSVYYSFSLRLLAKPPATHQQQSSMHHQSGGSKSEASVTLKVGKLFVFLHSLCRPSNRVVGVEK